MAKLRNAPPFMDRLESALIDALAANGIHAEVRAEPVPTTRLYRVAVLAPKFKALKHSERQNLVWRTLSPDELLRISMILTLTPDEVEAPKTSQRTLDAVKRQGRTVFGGATKGGHR